MAQHQAFSFRSYQSLLRKAEELGLYLPYQEEISPVFEPIRLGGKRLPNRLAVQPMEGYDAEPDGSPGEPAFRRYRRYAEGGSGLIWFEATSVVPEGKSNPRQLMIDARSLDGFQRLVEETRKAAAGFGSQHDVFLILQLTHSGRYSQPQGKPAPQAACLNPFLDGSNKNTPILGDGEFDRLQERYVEAAGFAFRAGFDAVDVKACHGYLVNELLAAYTRSDSRYGESFENRTRFLLEVCRSVRDYFPGIGLAVRLNAYDGLPHPFGFGAARESPEEVDLAEPLELVRLLARLDCSLFNITLGNPHLRPHLGRPFDQPLSGSFLPEEHPLEGVCRLLEVTARFQGEFPEIPMVGTGYSWLRQFFPQVGAAVLKRKGAAFIGLGRGSFAYPDSPRDLMAAGRLDRRRVCTACSRCSELTRALLPAGCVVRDKKVYGKIYQKLSGKATGS